MAASLSSAGQALPSSAEVKKLLSTKSPPTLKALHLTLIGDSISAGALAATQLGSQPSPELIAGIMAAIVTRDLQQFLTATLSPQSAYPDADGSWSLRQQLINHYKIPANKLILDNESVAGRSMTNVTDGLMKNLNPPKDAQAEHQLLLMLGSNDFCQGKSPDEFIKASAEALRLLDQKFPKAKFFVAAVPPIHQLKKLGQEPLLGQINCEAVQRLYCNRLYDANAESIHRAYNEGLQKLLQDINKKQPRERYRFVSMPPDLTLAKPLLAFDCFHPGEEGHKKLADWMASQITRP
jgi:lysophospholipase L1-like esterase